MPFNKAARLAVWAALALLSACGGGGSAPPNAAKPAMGDVVVEDFTVSGKDDGVQLHVHNKHPAEYYGAKPERTILFLHGATFPGSATFDLAQEGGSWMDWMAKRGYDVYALDVRGYGKSSRPPQMNQPAEANGPVVDGATALRDVSKAVDFILSRRNVDRLVLVGWSWGATLAGSYASQSGNRIERLVLYAPQWLRDEPAKPAEAKLGAWRLVPLSAIKERWLHDVPAKNRAELIPNATSEAWLNALKASDPDGAKLSPPALKVPSGVVADWHNSWGAGKPYWNPARISVPTLVVQGEWDVETPPDMGLSVFAQLTGAPARRYLLIGEGTHTLLLEKNRHHLFRAVQGFLEEKF